MTIKKEGWERRPTTGRPAVDSMNSKQSFCFKRGRVERELSHRTSFEYSWVWWPWGCYVFRHERPEACVVRFGTTPLSTLSVNKRCKGPRRTQRAVSQSRAKRANDSFKATQLASEESRSNSGRLLQSPPRHPARCWAQSTRPTLSIVTQRGKVMEWLEGQLWSCSGDVKP